MKSPNDVFDAKVAIDDVELLDCDLPLPQSECPDVRCGNGVSPSTFSFNIHKSFHLVIQACISKEQQCDLTDDCGDNSDELGLFCDEHSFLQSTFEDDDKPFGEFELPPPSMLQWQRRTGQTATPGTGASTDHTLYDSAGHYLFINSSQTVSDGERAELMSKVFKPGIYFKLIL